MKQLRSRRLLPERFETIGNGRCANASPRRKRGQVSFSASTVPFASYAFTIDPLGRVTEVDNQGSSGMPRVVLSQAFGAVGNCTGLSASINRTADFADGFECDFLSRMTSIRQTGQTGGNAVADKRVDFDYNALSQVTSIERFADLGGTQLVVDSDFAHDHAARLTELTHRQGSTGLRKRRAGSGQRSAAAVAHGISFAASPPHPTPLPHHVLRSADDALAAPTAQHVTGEREHFLPPFSSAQGSTVLADYGWTYDAFSRVTNFWSQADGWVAYNYDDTDQLTGADYNQLPDESFSYDLTGNRTMTGYVTGANNRLLSDGTFNYAYDDEGNRIAKTNVATGEVTEYSWDHRNRLVGIVEKDSQGQVTQSVGYSYDCFDRRIAKVITPAVGPSELEQYIYDGQHIALRFENGNLANRYLHGPVIDQILADEQLDIGTGQTDRLLWPLTDNLGSVRDVAEFNETTGITAIVDHIIYSAFGEIVSKTNPSLDHLFGYTGRETDPESDLLFYRARYYDPAIGRFISEDPIGFAAGDVNLNRMVGNGVTNATDPSGLYEVPGQPTPVAVSIDAPADEPSGSDVDNGPTNAVDPNGLDPQRAETDDPSSDHRTMTPRRWPNARRISRQIFTGETFVPVIPPRA